MGMHWSIADDDKRNECKWVSDNVGCQEFKITLDDALIKL